MGDVVTFRFRRGSRRIACPVCGDPKVFGFWVDVPPQGCAYDEEWKQGRPAVVRSVAECPQYISIAREAADRRRFMPEAFDEHGKMKPEMREKFWQAYLRAGRAADAL